MFAVSDICDSFLFWVVSTLCSSVKSAILLVCERLIS